MINGELTTAQREFSEFIRISNEGTLFQAKKEFERAMMHGVNKDLDSAIDKVLRKTTQTQLFIHIDNSTKLRMIFKRNPVAAEAISSYIQDISSNNTTVKGPELNAA